MTDNQQAIGAEVGRGHFGDPCVFCHARHHDVEPGPCPKNDGKPRIAGWATLGVRWDGIGHYRYQMTDGSIHETYQHVSNHAPYHHFGLSGDLVQPPRYDVTLQGRTSHQGPTRMIPEIDPEVVGREFLLVKRGLYYRPGNQGYTGIRDRAGRYLESDARPSSCVIAVHENDAPMFSEGCWQEVKVEFLLERIAELEALNRSLAQSQEVL